MPDFTITGHITKPATEVFEAVADPAIMSRYFTTGGAVGRMETGSTVSWDFKDFPGAFPVQVLEASAPNRIRFTWGAGEGTVEPGPDGASSTTVQFDFEELEDGRTRVRISESGWNDTPAALKASYGNCEGWTQMLCSLKAWLEHGIVLREGFYE